MGSYAISEYLGDTAQERDMQATISGLRDLDAVDRIGTVLRVIGPE